MKKIVKCWLSCWTYVMVLVSGILLGWMVTGWNVLDVPTKIYAIATALLPIHVLEEWYFPGGFHVMYNRMENSDCPNRYPMNQLSDMWTNFIGVIFGCIVLIIGVNPVFLVMQVMLCVGEISGHIIKGIPFVNKHYGAHYNPGLFTTVCGYLPIALCILVYFIMVQTPSVLQVVIGILCGMLLGGFAVKGPEAIVKSNDTPYAYDWGDGYFNKFIK